MLRRHLLLCAPALLLAGCAALSGRDPVRVQLVGLEPAEGGEALEMRLLARLRVQNPNDVAITFSGVALELSLRNNALGTGVSDAGATVPAFGEIVLAVPVTISAVGVLRTFLGLFMDPEPRPIEYVLRGKLGGGPFGSMRFESRGELTLPAAGAGFGTGT